MDAASVPSNSIYQSGGLVHGAHYCVWLDSMGFVDLKGLAGVVVRVYCENHYAHEPGIASTASMNTMPKKKELARTADSGRVSRAQRQD